MHERIALIRKESGLSLRAFGERVGITGVSVLKLENGTNNPSEQTIRAICREFKVSRQWLETGEGPSYLTADPEDDEIIDAVLDGEDEFVKAVIRAIARTPEGWEMMRTLFERVSDELKKSGG